jgi:hypothetical protein
MSRKTRFPLMLDPKQLDALKEIEERLGVTPSEQIRRAITHYLADERVVNEPPLQGDLEMKGLDEAVALVVRSVADLRRRVGVKRGTPKITKAERRPAANRSKRS